MIKNKKLIFNFGDKVALITGSSGKVGEKVAKYLAQLGFKLVITGRDVQKIKKIAESCRQLSNQKVVEISADLLNDREVERLLETTIEEFRRLDVLVNCAQISIPVSITDSNAIDSYDRVFNTNVRSVVSLTALAVPHIERTKGFIVNLCSDSGLRPYELEFAFGVSEAAMDWFTKGLALEMRSKEIKVLTLNSSLVMRPNWEMNPWFSTTLCSRL